MRSFLLVTERMLEDHLPGGIHNQSSYVETKPVPKTNKVSERDFALLDRLLQQKPNASTIAIESIILFSQNKTRKWIEKKSEAERKQLFQAARKLTPQFRKKYKDRRREIQQYRANVILKRKNDKEKKCKKDEAIRKQLVEEIEINGFWQSEERVEAELVLTKSIQQKKNKLKAQIKFRKLVLLQEYDDKSVFNFSKKGKQLSVEDFKNNLIKLINANEYSHNDSPSLSSNFKNSQYSNDPYIKEPSTLVGTTVEHTFIIDEGTGECQTFHGKIISQVKVGKDKTFFNIKYEGFEDKYWTYQILQDYIDGDLIII